MSKINKKEIKEIYNSCNEFINSLSQKEKEKFFIEKIEGAILDWTDNLDNIKTEWIRTLFECFKAADDEGKKAIIDSCIYVIMAEAYTINEEYTTYLCDKNGHDYSNWEEYKKTDTVTSIGCGCREVVVESGWKKVCSVCGSVVKSYEEPEEVRIEREIKEKEENIKTLQKEIEELEKGKQKIKRP